MAAYQALPTKQSLHTLLANGTINLMFNVLTTAMTIPAVSIIVAKINTAVPVTTKRLGVDIIENGVAMERSNPNNQI